MTNTPAVSVIIPMYNAEKFVGDCLDSLLAQMFQDFEVIVVDDRSTDNSVAVVESFAPKFDGRLKLLQLEKNSGSGAVPRNTGLKFSRGEYVFFADADDLFTLTALEELYALAKDFDADVVYCERFYLVSANMDKVFRSTEQKGILVDRPTLESEDLTRRVESILREQIWLTPWNKFVRRKFLLENELFFPPVKIAEDDIWTYGIFFCAKKFLRVPNIVYLWRQSEDSMMRRKKSPQETINFWINPVIYGLKTLDEILGKVEFFRLNPQYRCAMLEQLVHSKLAQLFESSLALSSAEIYAAIKDKFGNNLGSWDVLVSWIITELIVQQKVFVDDQKQLYELEKKVRK